MGRIKSTTQYLVTATDEGGTQYKFEYFNGRFDLEVDTFTDDAMVIRASMTKTEFRKFLVWLDESEEGHYPWHVGDTGTVIKKNSVRVRRVTIYEERACTVAHLLRKERLAKVTPPK